MALDADGEVTEPAEPAQAVVHGDAAALYLWFWRRASDDSVAVDGDRAGGDRAARRGQRLTGQVSSAWAARPG